MSESKDYSKFFSAGLLSSKRGESSASIMLPTTVDRLIDWLVKFTLGEYSVPGIYTLDRLYSSFKFPSITFFSCFTFNFSLRVYSLYSYGASVILRYQRKISKKSWRGFESAFTVFREHCMHYSSSLSQPIKQSINRPSPWTSINTLVSNFEHFSRPSSGATARWRRIWNSLLKA